MSAKPSAAELLADIMHPAWSPADDLELLLQKGRGVHFNRISIGMMRPAASLQQRWHRLRCVPGIERLLREYGLTGQRYSVSGHIAENGAYSASEGVSAP